MQKHLTIFSVLFWTNLAAGFAGGRDIASTPSSSFITRVLLSNDNVSETILAAVVLFFLMALHFFSGKKVIPYTKPASNGELTMPTTPTPLHTIRPTVAIIDDDIFIRESWELFLQEFNLITFDSPESFLLALDRNAPLITTLGAIVVDYDFGSKSSMSGADLASILRQKTSSPIILSTDREQKDISDFDHFDLHLDKNILDWHGLQKLLPVVMSQ